MLKIKTKIGIIHTKIDKMYYMEQLQRTKKKKNKTWFGAMEI